LNGRRCLNLTSGKLIKKLTVGDNYGHMNNFDKLQDLQMILLLRRQISSHEVFQDNTKIYCLFSKKWAMTLEVVLLYIQMIGKLWTKGAVDNKVYGQNDLLCFYNRMNVEYKLSIMLVKMGWREISSILIVFSVGFGK
jgi:hypothetical protein